MVTSQGRIVKVSVLDLPGLPPTDGTPSLSGGVPLGEVVTLLPRERVVGLTSLGADAPTLALATVQGTVKRVSAGDVPGNRDAWEAISLKDGDEVVGAAAVTDTDELVLLASDASLLHFPASAVRPQGRAAGGMAGIKLAAGQRVVAFGSVAADEAADAVVVTVAGRLRCAARHAGGLREGHAVRRLPGQGSRDRRGAGAPVPAQRGRPDARLGRRRAGVGDGLRRSADRAAAVDPRRDMSGDRAHRPGARDRLTPLRRTRPRCPAPEAAGRTCGPGCGSGARRSATLRDTTAAAIRPCPTV